MGFRARPVSKASMFAFANEEHSKQEQASAKTRQAEQIQRQSYMEVGTPTVTQRMLLACGPLCSTI